MDKENISTAVSSVPGGNRDESYDEVVKGLNVSSLRDFSVRTYNILVFNGVCSIEKLQSLTLSELEKLSRIDDDTLRELKDKITFEKIVKADLDDVISAKKALQLSKYRSKVLDFVRADDFLLEKGGLESKFLKYLAKRGVNTMSQLVTLDINSLREIKGIGEGAIEKIVSFVDEYLERNNDIIIAYCLDDKSVIYGDTNVRRIILNLYKNDQYVGYSLNEMKLVLALPDDYQESELKRNVSSLIADGLLEYTDYRCYRVYPAVSSFVEELTELDEKVREVIVGRINGCTLEEVGKKLGLTRERIRQLEKDAFRDLYILLYMQKGLYYFAEDYYNYLYETYDFDEKIAINWLGISKEEYCFLKVHASVFGRKAGKKNLEDAISDSKLNMGVRVCIGKYINRNNIFVDGIWIKKKISVIEDYILAKYCKDPITLEQFGELYNNFLAEQGVPYDEELFYSKKVIRTRENKIAKSKKALWSLHKTLRYYDLDSYDFTEFLDVLNLDSYSNTEISTLKLMDEYPELMLRYDIRNKEELHNLLRKLLETGISSGYKCSRMPNLMFGEFDRDEMIKSLMLEYAPITPLDLATIIRETYGHEISFLLGGGMSCIDDYLVQGEYRPVIRNMDSNNLEILSEALKEDYYTVDEVKHIYSEVVPGADVSEITIYNMKQIGFTLTRNCLIRNHSSVNDYFKSELLKSDIVDITKMRKRFTYDANFYKTYTTLKNSYKIVNLNINTIITLDKLEQAGITENELREFCDEVCNYIVPNRHYTIKMIKEEGFYSELFEYGFEDWFYASILAVDSRFSIVYTAKEIILYMGKEKIGARTIIEDIVNREGSVDGYDLLSDLEKYGFHFNYVSELVARITDTNIFYDDYLDRFYTSKKHFDDEVNQVEDM